MTKDHASCPGFLRTHAAALGSEGPRDLELGRTPDDEDRGWRGPFGLVDLMDRMHAHGGEESSPRWTAWKAAHPEVFGAVAQAVLGEDPPAPSTSEAAG